MHPANRASPAPARRPVPTRPGRIIASVPPNILLAVLVAGLLALIPVWRLRSAGWPGGWLQTAWLVGFLAVVAMLLTPSVGRFLAPVVLVLFVAPFALGLDRLGRLARRAAPPSSGVIIDVTPRPRDDGADGHAPKP